MNDEDRLADLLLQWENRHDQGEDISAEELCRDCPHLAPELARRIHALKVTSWLSMPDDCGMESAQDSPAPNSPLRTLAGRYRLDDKIAEGGFAEVWKGFDLELRRAVAVKMPKPGRLPSAERFMAEARRVAALKHPGVVPVFDVGRDGDSCFIVSEFVEGGSLADRITKKQPTTQEAARLVAEIAETLLYAHQHGFVHRDIKPGNILIDHHGRALLTDFGIAHSPEDKAEGGNGSFGTLAYMSPEQIQGQPVDHCSDIYSLGIVLHEMLSGELPHQATDPVELRRQIVTGAVSRVPKSVSNGLERICLKCLAKNPADRYQDAGKLAADLRRSAASSSPSRRLIVGLAGLLLVATVAGVVIFKLSNPTTEPPGDPGTVTKKDEKEHQASTGDPGTVTAKDMKGLAASGNTGVRANGSVLKKGTVERALALGDSHFSNKEWDKAEAAYTEAIKLKPECAEAYHRRAGSLFNAGKAKESLPDFDVAARLDPKNAEVCKNRGIAYLNLLQFEEALADFRHALELDPDHPEPYRKVLGQTYARRAEEHDHKKKRNEAIADMDEAIRLDPKNAGYFDRRGSCHYNLKHFTEAVADFTEAIVKQYGKDFVQEVIAD